MSALNGSIGEQEVVKLVSCPNCSNALMVLPSSYPLYDVQCKACMFRAQIKTSNSKPKSVILGAGWDVMEKVLKAGFFVPPLIVNFKWTEKGNQKQKIIFYPFIPRDNLKKRTLSENARRAKYRMFNYVGLDKLPSIVLFEKS
jgi:hypothetical protein